MTKIISFTISDQQHKALEAASRLEGIDLIQEAAKLFTRGLHITSALPKEQIKALDSVDLTSASMSQKNTAISEFEARGAKANSSDFLEIVNSIDFQNSFRKLIESQPADVAQ